MLRLAADSVFSFSLVPLRLAVWLGLLAAALALLGIVYAFAIRVATDEWVPGWTALFIAVLFLSGSQLVLIGVLGEYVGRIYGEVKRRPLYIAKERLGFPPPVARSAGPPGPQGENAPGAPPGAEGAGGPTRPWLPRSPEAGP